MENQSLAHSRYNCMYHIVFIPKDPKKRCLTILEKKLSKPFVRFVKRKEPHL